MLDEKWNWTCDRSEYVVRANPALLPYRSHGWRNWIIAFASARTSQLHVIREPRATHQGRVLTTLKSFARHPRGIENDFIAQFTLAAIATCEDVHCGDLVRIEFDCGEDLYFAITPAGETICAKEAHWACRQAYCYILPMEFVHPQWPILIYDMPHGMPKILTNVSFAGCPYEMRSEHSFCISVGKSSWNLIHNSPFLLECAAMLTCSQAPPVTVYCQTTPMGDLTFEIVECKGAWGCALHTLIDWKSPGMMQHMAQFPLHEYIPVYRLSTFAPESIKSSKVYIDHIIEAAVACGLPYPVARMIAMLL